MAWSCVASKPSIDHCHSFVVIYMSLVRSVLLFSHFRLNTHQISTIPTNVEEQNAERRRERSIEKNVELFVGPL